MADHLLQATAILDYDQPSIQDLISARKWRELPTHERIGVAYEFVRDEIKFGYNKSDDLKASQVLQEGIGQCNTKANLLMAPFESSWHPLQTARIHDRQEASKRSGDGSLLSAFAEEHHSLLGRSLL